MTSDTDADVNRLSYWFPRVKLAGLPVPRTRLVPLDDDEPDQLSTLLDGETPPCLARITGAIAEAALALGGPPCFLRTDFLSGKHSWVDTCYVTDLRRLAHHVYHLVEYSAMADLFGLRTDLFAVRELFWTRPAFHAFHRMPVAREFRLFVRDGVVEHLQPYWPPDAIKFWGGLTEPPTWRAALAAISQLTALERTYLETLACRASAAVPGFWSVDFLETAHAGWMLIDMALGAQSYRWDPTTPPAEPD